MDEECKRVSYSVLGFTGRDEHTMRLEKIKPDWDKVLICATFANLSAMISVKRKCDSTVVIHVLHMLVVLWSTQNL